MTCPVTPLLTVPRRCVCCCLSSPFWPLLHAPMTPRSRGSSAATKWVTRGRVRSRTDGDGLQVSQNVMNASLAASVLSPQGSVWLPMGVGKQVTGIAAAQAFFTAFFGNFKSIVETVELLLISGTTASIKKTFAAVAQNGCQISLPVLQTFVSNDGGHTLAFIGAVWNATLFGVQYSCSK